MSMDEFYYKVFRSNKTDKPHVLLPNGHHCKPVYPVTYGYARSVIIQHMPWSEANPPTELLKDQNKTIQKFKSMIDKRELPSSIYNQYICAIKYSQIMCVCVCDVIVPGEVRYHLCNQIFANQGVEAPCKNNEVNQQISAGTRPVLAR